MQQKAERAGVEVARVAWGFPRTPEGRDQLLRQVKEITAGLDPAAVMIALGALLRRESTGHWMKAEKMRRVSRSPSASSKDGLAGRNVGWAARTGPVQW